LERVIASLYMMMKVRVRRMGGERALFLKDVCLSRVVTAHADRFQRWFASLLPTIFDHLKILFDF